MNATSTVAPRAHAIDPKIFLDYFTACGGGYAITPDGQLWLGILQNSTNPDRSIAAQIMREVKPTDAARIKNYLIARQSGLSEAADKWSAAMVRFRIAERAYQDCVSAEVVDDEKADELCDIESDARWALMAMPAPDRPALLWKLEYLFQGSNGTLDPYTLESVAQTVEDMRRLLVEG
jgi:hypothetical protein